MVQILLVLLWGSVMDSNGIEPNLQIRHGAHCCIDAAIARSQLNVPLESTTPFKQSRGLRSTRRLLPAMSPPQSEAHHTMYNGLPLIPDAYTELRRELKAAPSVSNNDLMLPILEDPDVCKLFRDGVGEGDEGRFFGIWIVHRHFRLERGERMVAEGDVAKPVSENLTHLAERWDHYGNAIEFMQPGADQTPQAPSANFTRAFRELMYNKFGVSSLGLCRVGRRLAPGCIYLETTEVVRRAQITQIVPIGQETLDSEPSGLTYPSSWVIADPDSAYTQIVCNCTCKVCSFENT